ncbi:MAG TPA: class I SAM-dependent methyltransferase [Nitrospirales bacterium]|nr:class I SAM-dependent methyltransferase [Nitrospira sp. MA-1]HNP60348.1 class I SAM-dependent methyltransferase [Nitrospirales bacterium]
MPGMFKSPNKAEDNILSDLGPLYHNYSFFGVNNVQLPGIYELNQQAKAPIIIAYIAYAIAKSKKHALDRVSLSELFCADGFYAMVASRLGCNRSIGIDNDRDKHFEHANVIAERLNLHGVEFEKEEITPNSKFISTDVVVNVGGLYHVDAPDKILDLSYGMANKYLIVQSVVSLKTESEDYFEAPAPGWTWGNRYSRKSFDKMIKKICPKIIDQHFNELEGNNRLEDRGSVYYLIEK